MTLKLKTLAALVALAASSSAFALEGNSTTKGNSSIIFNAWDADAGVSYTLDIGFNFDDFATLGSGAFTSNLASDTNWTTFLAASTLSNIVWDVRAWSIPANQANAKTTILTTLQTGEDFDNIVASNGNLGTTAGGIKLAATGNSSIANNPVFTSGSYYSAPGGSSGTYAGTYGENWSGKVGFNTIGSIGDSLKFYSLDNSGGSYNANARQVTNYVALGSWTLSSSGNLSYSIATVTPVPEPSQNALFFAGLVVMGALARKRLG